MVLPLGMRFLFIQNLKFSFVNLLWSITDLSNEDGPKTLVRFID